MSMKRAARLLPIALAGAWAAVVLATPPLEDPVRFLSLYALAFALYAVAVAGQLRGARTGLVAIVVVGLAMRVLSLAGAPSDDLHRYVWEGEVQRHGANPYVLPPDAPELRTLAERFPDHERINHPDWPAIYPPVAQIWMRFFAHGALSLKLSFLAVDLGILFLLFSLLRRFGLPRERAMIYWWNPLVVLSFFVEGHNDLLGLALLLLAIWLLGRGRRLGAGGAAGLAVAAKIFPLAALPSYARKAGVAPLLAGAAAALGSAWLFLTPQLDIFRSLVRFGGELSYNDSIHALVERGLAFVGLDGGLGSRAVVASLWFAVALLVARTTSAASNELARARGAAVSIGALLLLLPTAHPWYFTLIVPFLCFFSWTGWIAMSGMAVLPHLAQLEIAHTGTWVEWHALKWIEYGPLFGWLSWRASLRMTGSVRATPSGPVARAREES